MRLLAISGSLRAASYNTALLRAAAELAPEGVTVELYEGLDRLPHYNEDLDNDAPPFEVARLRERIARSDAVLVATPEFNGTMPGHLKAAIDWASRPHRSSALWGKPAVVIGASVTDYGAIWAQDHVRKALGLAGARVLDAELVVPKARECFTGECELVDGNVRRALADLLDGLAEHRESAARAA